MVAKMTFHKPRLVGRAFRAHRWSLDILPTETEANPEGWQMVAGGRSGQGGERPPESVSWVRAPRRGARSNPDVLPLWHPCRGAGHLLGRYPEVAALRKPPVTSGYPLSTLWVDRLRMSRFQSKR